MFNISFFIFRRDLRLDIFFGLARKFGVGFGGQVYFDDIPAKDFAVNKKDREFFENLLLVLAWD